MHQVISEIQELYPDLNKGGNCYTPDQKGSDIDLDPFDIDPFGKNDSP